MKKTLTIFLALSLLAGCATMNRQQKGTAGGAAAGAAILGLIAIRVRAIPFLMMTLAFGEITYGTARHWSSLTNGEGKEAILIGKCRVGFGIYR